MVVVCVGKESRRPRCRAIGNPQLCLFGMMKYNWMGVIKVAGGVSFPRDPAYVIPLTSSICLCKP
jgi:hypothetical protein